MDFIDADRYQGIAYLLSLILVRDHLANPNPYEPCSIILHDIMTASMADERMIRVRLCRLLNFLLFTSSIRSGYFCG